MKKFIVFTFCVLVACVPIASSQSDQKGREGLTPLMRAAEGGQVNVVRSLLKSGAAVDGKGRGGMTPLMLAARKGHLSGAEGASRSRSKSEHQCPNNGGRCGKPINLGNHVG